MQYPMIAQPQYAFAPTMMAQGGSVAAQNVQAQGRGNDTMLVHMTPGEVGGLQALARAHGGSLSINPNTGLPEAGFLETIFPVVAGAALTAVTGNPYIAAGLVGGGTAVMTGDLGKGLVAGLGAFGGANIAGSAANLASAGAPEVVTAATDLTNQAVTQSPLTMVSETGAGAIPNVAPTVGDIYQTSGARDALLARSGEVLPASVQALPTPGVTPENLRVGFGKVFESPSALMDFAGENKMNLALSAAPMLMPEEPAPPPQGRKFQHRTYDLDVQNLSGSTPIDPFGRESRQIGYTFTPSNPNEEKIRYAEGGSTGFGGIDPGTPVSTIPVDTSGGLAVMPGYTPQNYAPFAQVGGRVSPEQMVMSDIASVQRLAGLPAIAPTLPRETQYRYDLVAPGALPPVSEQPKGFDIAEYFKSKGKKGSPGDMIFYRPKGGGRGVFSGSPMFAGAGSRDPKDYQQFTPTGEIRMSDYVFDPDLGGYVESPALRAFEAAKTGGAIRDNKVQAPMLENGGFVLTKKAVDGLGKGSNEKGQKVASRGLGAIPIKGPGTGTSDSIKTSIEGKRPALVSNGEAYVPKKQVAKRGGAKKFYDLMRKAERRA